MGEIPNQASPPLLGNSDIFKLKNYLKDVDPPSQIKCRHIYFENTLMASDRHLKRHIQAYLQQKKMELEKEIYNSYIFRLDSKEKRTIKSIIYFF